MTKKKPNKVAGILRKHRSLPVVVLCSIAVFVLMLITPLEGAHNDSSPSEQISLVQPEQNTTTIGAEITLGEYVSDFIDDGSGTGDISSSLLKALNGLTIEPQAVISFNEIASSAISDFEYQTGIIFQDQEYGAGHGCSICQVSTALYVASLKSGCDILERHGHSEVVDYAPFGFDARVADNADLKIQNTSDQNMMIVAKNDEGKIDLKIIGKDLGEGVTIELTARIIQNEGQNKEEAGEGVQDLTYYVDTSRVYYREGTMVRTDPLARNTYVSAAQ